jgi:hypothetical protein
MEPETLFLFHIPTISGNTASGSAAAYMLLVPTMCK